MPFLHVKFQSDVDFPRGRRAGEKVPAEARCSQWEVRATPARRSQWEVRAAPAWRCPWLPPPRTSGPAEAVLPADWGSFPPLLQPSNSSTRPEMFLSRESAEEGRPKSKRFYKAFMEELSSLFLPLWCASIIAKVYSTSFPRAAPYHTNPRRRDWEAARIRMYINLTLPGIKRN